MVSRRSLRSLLNQLGRSLRSLLNQLETLAGARSSTTRVGSLRSLLNQRGPLGVGLNRLTSLGQKSLESTTSAG